MDIAVSADHTGKIKESEKIDKHLDLAIDLKSLWNMKVTVISVVIGALGKVLEKRQGEKKSDNEPRPTRTQHY